jgi:hypothetical protein
MIEAGQLAELFALRTDVHEALCRHLPPAGGELAEIARYLDGALFGPIPLTFLLRRLTAGDGTVNVAEWHWFETFLGRAPLAILDLALDAIRVGSPFTEAFLTWIVRVGRADVDRLFAFMESSPPRVAPHLVGLLGTIDPPRANGLRLSRSPHVRLAAELFLNPSQDPSRLLAYLDADEAQRDCFMVALCTYSAAWSFGTLIRVVSSSKFGRLHPHDREQLLMATLRAGGRDAEQALTEILQKGTSPTASGEHHHTRVQIRDALAKYRVMHESVEIDKRPGG